MGLQNTAGMWLEQLWGMGWSEWVSAEAGQDVGTAWFWLSHAPVMKHGPQRPKQTEEREAAPRSEGQGPAHPLLASCPNGVQILTAGMTA